MMLMISNGLLPKIAERFHFNLVTFLAMHFKSSGCFLMDYYVMLIDCACPSVFIQIQTHFILKDKQ